MDDDLTAELGRLAHDQRHSLSVHQPTRPSWRCRACHAPWPCPARREEISVEFVSRLDAAFYLVAWLRDAISDHPQRAGELIERFLLSLRSTRFHGDHQPMTAIMTTIPARALAWSASAPGGDVLAEATALALLHRPGPDGTCRGCLDLGRLGDAECRHGEWARAALAALRT